MLHLIYNKCPCRWTDITIITIREAAWLTDNTYKYSEVVCMIGELIAALSGEIQVREINH